MFYIYVDIDLQDVCISLYLYTHFVCKHIYKYYIHMFSIWDICSKWLWAKKHWLLDPNDGPPESGPRHPVMLPEVCCVLGVLPSRNTKYMYTYIFIYIIFIVLCNVDTLAFGVNPSSILDSTLAAFEEKFIPTKHRMTWHSSLIWRWMEQSLGHWQKDRICLVDHALR